MSVSITAPQLKINLEKPVVRDLFKRGVIRHDAELVYSYTYDRNIVRDEGITLPQYTMNLIRLKESEELSSTIPFDSNYYYLVLSRMLTIPIYSINVGGQGREEYCYTTQGYELIYFPSGTFKTLNNGTEYGFPVYSFNSRGGITEQMTWISDTDIDVYSVNSLGVTQIPRSPGLGSSSIFVYSPTFQIRGNDFYFSETYYNALTDVRFQYVIEVWRVLRGSMNSNGWTTTQELELGINCAQSETHKLT